MTHQCAEIKTVSSRARWNVSFSPGSVYSRLLFLYVCLLISILGAASLNCAILPQYITARVAPIAFAAELGSPPQELSLLLSTISNETLVPSKLGCSKYQQYGFASSFDCETSVGGIFDPDNSTSYTRIGPFNTTDFMDNSARAANGSLSRDIFILPQSTLNVTIDQFEFGLIDDTLPIGYEIGLGPGSSLLRRLLDMNLIPSNSYSIDPLLPALTLGGYDQAGFTGSFHDYPLPVGTNHSSLLHVSVVDIIIEYPHNPGKPSVSLMQHSVKQFDTSIDPFPDILPIILPQDVTAAFMKETGAATIASRDVPQQQKMLLLAPDMNNTLHYPNQFAGVMKVVLSDGFNTTIPNSMLVWNTTTKSNDSIWMSGVGMPSSRQPRFGSSFLNSGVYLAVNYERQKFSLANSLLNVDVDSFPSLIGGS
ncbi:aspartic peptidase domain-containing protein [Trichophaea hybrida]|nr:aspartic peptidase domain-containing protein [Trichophaea hybrida]